MREEAAGACDDCLARSWLLAALAAHLEPVRTRTDQLLTLADDDVIAAVAGADSDAVAAAREAFDPAEARERARDAGLEHICRCSPAYPTRLRALEAPPAVLHVAGGLERFLDQVGGEPVAVVGARRATSYGLEIARALGRDLARAAVPVISGLALGIDSAAHAGAASGIDPAAHAGAASGITIAVMAAGAERPYPASRRALHRQIVANGAAVSEMPPGTAVWRWMLTARNRIIAALAAMTVVVEAGERSGALLTARHARSLGRPVGAVPGRVTAPMSAGPNALLAGGAYVVRGAQDVLDQLFGAGIRAVPELERAELAPELRVLLAAIADGRDSAAALARAGFTPEHGLAALAALELAGYVRREAGGRFSVTA